jgi:hypothetical protein
LITQLKQQIIEFGLNSYDCPGLWTKNRPEGKQWFRKNGINAYSDKALHAHLTDGKNIGYAFNKITTGFCIDIDNHKELYSKKVKEKIIIIRNLVIEYLGHPHYIEENKYNGGEHLWYKIKPIDFKIIQHFPQWFYEKTGYKIETPPFMRLFYSNQYQYVPMRLAVHPISEFKFINLINFNLNYKKRKTVEELRNETIFWKKNKEKKGLSKNHLYQIHIGCGTRNAGMLEMVRINSYLGYPCSMIELTNIARQIDCGSKDFKKWTDLQIEKVFTLMNNSWNPNNSNQIQLNGKEKESKKPDNLISNNELIPYKIKQQINDTYFLNQIVEKYNCKYEKKKKEVRKATNYLLKHIIGKLFYMQTVEKGIFNWVPYTSELKKGLLQGFQISYRELQLIKETFNLKIDIRKLFNCIMSLDMFSQYKINNLGYIPHISCRQYTLNVNEVEKIRSLEYYIYSLLYVYSFNYVFNNITKYNINNIIKPKTFINYGQKNNDKECVFFDTS